MVKVLLQKCGARALHEHELEGGLAEWYKFSHTCENLHLWPLISSGSGSSGSTSRRCWRIVGTMTFLSCSKCSIPKGTFVCTTTEGPSFGLSEIDVIKIMAVMLKNYHKLKYIHCRWFQDAISVKSLCFVRANVAGSLQISCLLWCNLVGNYLVWKQIPVYTICQTTLMTILIGLLIIVRVIVVWLIFIIKHIKNHIKNMIGNTRLVHVLAMKKPHEIFNEIVLMRFLVIHVFLKLRIINTSCLSTLTATDHCHKIQHSLWNLLRFRLMFSIATNLIQESSGIYFPPHV